MCDVLDNWEEIDEAGLTNTLQKIQAERKTQEQLNSTASTPVSANTNLYSSTYSSSSVCGNSQPMKLLQRTPTQDSNSSTSSTSAGGGLKSPLDDMAATFQPVMMVLHKTDDEYQSANYTPAISSSTVKILRRPTQSSEPRNNGMRPRQPIKTLQQREQEYAEARLRILGSAKNPEDDVASSNANAPASPAPAPVATIAATPTPTKVNSMSKIQGGGGSNSYNHYQQQQQQHFYYQQQSPAYNNRTLPMQPHQQQQPQTWSPVVGGSVSSPTLRQQLQIQQQQQQDSILRMPRGPDGSIGFQTRR